ncbi:hypothetical protein [Mycolicibacterium fluoranthenivorans]|uniref:Uncharacterized protein n=1 Tax=Mycolicibacterium fluoranthenivorans TaxID=258505 RepID=A0A7X5U5M1_9MYCO|nr:hypothetical protein [Mycolicibacterium fluoranthenivorans]NIH98881.1 hypothetical protein [Mycolicibacterium fluoranthenivorans]
MKIPAAITVGALAGLTLAATVAYLWLIGVAPQFEKQLSHH